MMSHSPLARSEAGLAYAFLLPPLAVVISIVLVPGLANFWISENLYIIFEGKLKVGQDVFSIG